MCRKHGIGDQRRDNRKAKYGGLKPSGSSRLKGLEEENRRLKTPPAEAVLDKPLLPGLQTGTDRACAAVRGVGARARPKRTGTSRLIGVDRSALRDERTDRGGAALRSGGANLPIRGFVADASGRWAGGR